MVSCGRLDRSHYGDQSRPGARMFCGSKADLSRRIRDTSVRATAEREEERCRLEARATKSGPQILIWRLSSAGHQEREAEAFSAELREKTAEATSAKCWSEGTGSAGGRT